MNSIKYRLWDPVNRKLVDSEEFSRNDVILYTGFMDKEDVEIYSGDIIHYEPTKSNVEILEVVGGLTQWGLFVQRYEPLDYIFPLRGEYVLKYAKVLGNIYLNPTLLQDEDLRRKARKKAFEEELRKKRLGEGS